MMMVTTTVLHLLLLQCTCTVGFVPQATLPSDGFLRFQASASAINEPSHNPSNATTRPTCWYEILGASPLDTRAELKRKYVQLAKQTHPDARPVGRTHAVEFSDIAAAYRVLSDPQQRKRYDRELRAQRWSLEIQELAQQMAEKAAPQVADILDTVAMPFLRRTTATTLASFQAAANQWTRPPQGGGDGGSTSSSELSLASKDLGDVLATAIKAAQKAGHIVDNIELLEKSQALESKIMDQLHEANKIRAELGETTLQRLLAALQTPHAAFSAEDASQILALQNVSSTFWERAKLRTPMDRRIRRLAVAETAWTQKQADWESAQATREQWERDLRTAQTERERALQAEQRAREAWTLAQRQVQESQARWVNATQSLSHAERALEAIDHERRRMADELARRQEKVRRAVRNRREIAHALARRQEGNHTEESMAFSLDLQQLMVKEAALVREYHQLEMAASQLQAKANQLRDRAERQKSPQ